MKWEVSMRWLLTASLIVGLTVVPVSAQRRAPMGHAGGFSGPRGFAAPRMSGGFSAGTHFSPAPIMTPRTFSAPPQSQYRWRAPIHYGNQPVHPAPTPDHHYGRQHYPSSHYRQPYVPYFYARSTYLVPGLLNSYWDYPNNWYSGDQSASYSNSTEAQVDQNPDYSPEPAAPYEPQQMPDIPPPPPGPVEPLPQAAVTLIFKDGHSQQVHNYAMTKTTLYVLDDAASGRRPEISLDQINMSATERANREAGVDFVVPAGAN